MSQESTRAASSTKGRTLNIGRKFLSQKALRELLNPGWHTLDEMMRAIYGAAFDRHSYNQRHFATVNTVKLISRLRDDLRKAFGSDVAILRSSR